MIDIRIHDGRYVITLPNSVLVLTKAEFIQVLRRGQWWRRREALQARLPREHTPEGPSTNWSVRGSCPRIWTVYRRSSDTP